MINFSNNEKALIFLSTLDFITSAKYSSIMDKFENISDIFSATPKELFMLKDIFKTKYEIFLDNLINFNSNEFFSALEKRGIGVTTILSDNYPQKLMNLKNPPYVLYYVGDLNLVKCRSVAVVGTRSPSAYGKLITEKYAKELAQNSICIVSGLATGVDKISHESALEVGGKTIAVMGGGFDHIFPAVNINLAREIGKNGLILTEYYNTVSPTKYTFPTRNRIIAALSEAVLIPEARSKSGSLYTKEYADELGIDTYCVPGNITSEKSEVPNRLIKNGNAICTTSPKDILIDFGISENRKSGSKNNLGGIQYTLEQTEIINLLKDGEQTFEFLQEKTNFSPQILNFNLTTLEISGIIRKLAGNSYILINYNW